VKRPTYIGMQTLTVEVAQDHIDSLSKAKKPILALAELIWNSVDADATQVDVRLNRNSLNGIDAIEVSDNGLGITMVDAQAGFGHLGGSWKQHEHHTRREKRILHGRHGQGRFRAFALCERVEWESVYTANGRLTKFKITGTTENKRQFTISDEGAADTAETGTVATMSNIVPAPTSLEVERAIPELNKLLALYLRQYPHVRVSYDGVVVDPTGLEENVADYDIGPFTTDEGKEYDAKLTIIEWKPEMERALYLCNEAGFTLKELPPGIQAPGYKFTAYLRSKLIEEMDENGTIDMEEFGELKRLLDLTKDRMRYHFLQRDAQRAAGVVDRWKEEEVYPFKGTPKDVMEETERQIFDVVAVSLDSYVSEFKEVKPKTKRLTFSLLRYALESNPSSLQFILSEVVGLPKEKQDEFAALLQKTSLMAMINASKIVTDRLDFLKGLEYLLYDPECRAKVKERSQLHKLVSRNTWIFGDEFFLVNNDESLTNVLRKHVKHAVFEMDEVDTETPVLREDGTEGVVDVGLSNIPPQGADSTDQDVVISKILDRQPIEGRHHLVIELKRPSQKINTEVLSQTESYAFAIARDERFQGLNTAWTFWALSNEMTDEARFKTEQSDRPRGMVYQMKNDPNKNYSITVWAKTWSEVIEQCTGRLKFFQERLNYNASQSSGRQFLRDTYPKFIPDFVKADKEKGK
jgi:hypothetical protein